MTRPAAAVPDAALSSRIEACPVCRAHAAARRPILRLQNGPVGELVAAPGHRPVVVVEHPEGERRVETDEPLKVIARLLEAGLEHPVRLEKPDLESVFLTLTGRRLRD